MTESPSLDRAPTWTVRMHGVSIGYSDLAERDDAARIARGTLRPAIGYDLVQPIFRLYTEAVPERDAAPRDCATLERFEKARAALSLTLVDPSGAETTPRAIMIYDYPDRDVELEVRF